MRKCSRAVGYTVVVAVEGEGKWQEIADTVAPHAEATLRFSCTHKHTCGASVLHGSFRGTVCVVQGAGAQLMQLWHCLAADCKCIN